jgi:hypothetical protein
MALVPTGRSLTGCWQSSLLGVVPIVRYGIPAVTGHPSMLGGRGAFGTAGWLTGPDLPAVMSYAGLLPVAAAIGPLGVTGTGASPCPWPSIGPDWCRPSACLPRASACLIRD